MTGEHCEKCGKKMSKETEDVIDGIPVCPDIIWRCLNKKCEQFNVWFAEIV